MQRIVLTKNALVFKRNPQTGYLEVSRFEIRAGAEIEAVLGETDVQMPNGAICAKPTVSFEEPWSRQTLYLLLEELDLPASVSAPSTEGAGT